MRIPVRTTERSPDGRTSDRRDSSATLAPHQRLCHDEALACPRCAKPIRRVHAGAGSFFYRCEEKVHTPIPGSNGHGVEVHKCGQHVHVVAVEGIAITTAITREQFEQGTAGRWSAQRLYEAAGLIERRLTSADPADVPAHACRGCGRARKLYDLYGGECRWCRDGLDAPELSGQPGDSALLGASPDAAR